MTGLTTNNRTKAEQKKKKNNGGETKKISSEGEARKCTTGLSRKL